MCRFWMAIVWLSFAFSIILTSSLGATDVEVTIYTRYTPGGKVVTHTIGTTHTEAIGGTGCEMILESKWKGRKVLGSEHCQEFILQINPQGCVGTMSVLVETPDRICQADAIPRFGVTSGIKIGEPGARTVDFAGYKRWVLSLDPAMWTWKLYISYKLADDDLDCIPNEFEMKYWGDPTSPQTGSDDPDFDGRKNTDEWISNTDPTKNDTTYDMDGDELPDLTELNIGTFPDISDSDDDGANDFIEFSYETDPLDPDMDSDALFADEFSVGPVFTDGYEIEYGSDPTSYFSPDSDGDGLPDSWESDTGLDPFDDTGDNGADGNPDGDGFTNIEEFRYGTDPNHFTVPTLTQCGLIVLLVALAVVATWVVLKRRRMVTT